MFILFGWGHRTTKDRGPTLPINCPNCHNDTWLRFISFKKWFTLFFIPIIPYKFENLLICPVCSSGIELNGETFNEALRLNEAATSLMNEEIGEKEFIKISQEVKLLPEK